jgi:hypothetical protein
MIDHKKALQRLTADREAGTEPKDPPPNWIYEARKHRLRRPLKQVPIGTRIELRIEVPNNAGGNYGQLSGIYLDGDCDDLADARQTFMELVAVFLDHYMPIER